ncbi:hypothetical protein DFH27DRAFT_574539 [Peziza echinospora]|nr:hypothetical protein DFH27DRAFT_574539 [Peziza echinospora]
MTKIIIYTCIACVLLIALCLGYTLLRRHRHKKLGSGDDVVEPKPETPLKSQPASMGNISEAGGSEIHLQELPTTTAAAVAIHEAPAGKYKPSQPDYNGQVYQELQATQQAHPVYELPPSPAPAYSSQNASPNPASQATFPPSRESVGAIKSVNYTPVPDFLPTQNQPPIGR